MTPKSAASIAKPLLAHGLMRAMSTAFIPFVAELKNSAPTDGAAAAIASVVSRREQLLADAIDQYGGGIPFEPKLAPVTGADKARGLMGAWDAAGKQLNERGGLAAVAGPFQSFGVAATQRALLSGIPPNDMAMLNNLMLMLALGALAYWATGQGAAGDQQAWATEAADRSGAIDILTSSDHIIEGWTGDQSSITAPTKGASPRAGRLFDLADLSRAIASGTISAADVGQIKRLLPLQNLFYVRWLFNTMEAGTTHAFGIPMRQAG